MAIGSGAIGQFAIGQGSSRVDLVATALAPASPVLDSPVATVKYSLTASALTPSSPSLDTPTLSHKYSATASGFNTAQPSLGSPAFSYSLTASALAPASPDLGTPALSAFYNVSANALAPASPALDTPTLSHRYTATALDFAPSSPSLATPVIQVMQANDLTTGSPSLDTPPYNPCLLGIDTYVKLLMHGDGSNGSTTLVDNGPLGKSFTAGGNAQLSTSSPKFGTASMLFDGSGDYFTTTDDTALHLGSNDWTIDCWFKRGGGDGTRRHLFGQGDAANTAGLLSIRAELFNTTNSLSVVVGRDVTPFQVRVTGATAVTDSNWHHAAFVRSGTSILVFLDGALDGSGTFTGPVFAATSNFSVGRAGEWDTFYFNGNIDEFRYTAGIARWTSAFTPPTIPYGYCCAAAEITPSSPELDAPALTHHYSATASDFAPASPALDTPTLSHAYTVSASNLTTTSPELGSPSLTHAYQPTALDLNTGQPVLDAPMPMIGLVASGLTTNAPALDTPALTHAYSVSANNLATGSPVLDTPSLTHAYSAVAVDLATGAPELDAPSLFVLGDFTALPLVTGSPVLDAPAASVNYPLVATSLATGSPVLDAPALSHRYSATALDLTTASPELGSPVVIFGGFLALNLETASPALDTPTLSHRYSCVALDLNTGSPVLGAPSAIVHADLVAIDLETGAPDLGTPAYGVFFDLLALDLETEAPELDQPVCSDVVPLRPELGPNLSDILLDPIYASVISNPARVYPSTPGLPPIDLSCINHTNGITVEFGIGVQTVRPAVDVRTRELAVYGIQREDLTNGQVVLWPDTIDAQVWNIESVFPRPGIWGEAPGELRLFLMDRTS